jgi:hypothetical protein
MSNHQNRRIIVVALTLLVIIAYHLHFFTPYHDNHHHHDGYHHGRSLAESASRSDSIKEQQRGTQMRTKTKTAPLKVFDLSQNETWPLLSAPSPSLSSRRYHMEDRTDAPKTSAVPSSPSSASPWIGSRRVAVIVESRPYLDQLARTISLFMETLSPEWRFILVHTSEHEKDIITNVSLHNMLASKRLTLWNLSPHFPSFTLADANQEEYSTLLCSLPFWESMAADHALIYQLDSVPCRSQTSVDINDFLQYDYVGAPWPHALYPSGNGGLSLRNVNVAIRILQMAGAERSPIRAIEPLTRMAHLRSIANKHIAKDFTDLHYCPEDVWWTCWLSRRPAARLPTPQQSAR